MILRVCSPLCTLGFLWGSSETLTRRRTEGFDDHEVGLLRISWYLELLGLD